MDPEDLSFYKKYAESLPPLSQSLKRLYIYGCYCLMSLPPLPESLIVLRLVGSNLTSLPPLPKGLKILETTQCDKLTSLPPLPDELENLEIFKCPMLTSLPPLSNYPRTYLFIRDCPLLYIEEHIKLTYDIFGENAIKNIGGVIYP